MQSISNHGENNAHVRGVSFQKKLLKINYTITFIHLKK